jgi:ArsR family metal-binding transcriptional regulator
MQLSQSSTDFKKDEPEMLVITAEFLYSFPLLISSMEIRLSRPCVDDPTRYIAECNLGKKVNIAKLCDILRQTCAKELKCSVRLGVARFEHEGRSVMLYQSGRVDVRKIKDTGEAEKIMEQIIYIIKDALSDISS